jgi:hypothetical protein
MQIEEELLVFILHFLFCIIGIGLPFTTLAARPFFENNGLSGIIINSRITDANDRAFAALLRGHAKQME